MLDVSHSISLSELVVGFDFQLQQPDARKQAAENRSAVPRLKIHSHQVQIPRLSTCVLYLLSYEIGIR